MSEVAIAKLAELKEKLIHTEDLRVVNQWEEDILRSSLEASLLDNDAFKMILKKYIIEFREINFLLQTDDKLTEDERKHLFWRKKWLKDFLSISSNAKAQVTKIEKEVDKELKHLRELGF